jgi:hypothetical protein
MSSAIPDWTKAPHAIQEPNRDASNDGADPTSKRDWEELAIEWHTMANFAARATDELTDSESHRAE